MKDQRFGDVIPFPRRMAAPSTAASSATASSTRTASPTIPQPAAPTAGRRRTDERPATKRKAAKRGSRAAPRTSVRERVNSWVKGTDVPRHTTVSGLLTVLLVGLNLFGLVMVLSASSVVGLEDHGSSWHFFNRQLVAVTIGLVAMAVVQRIDYDIWRRLAPAGIVLGFLLMFAVFIPHVGLSANGATRWIGIGPARMQPSEAAKLAVLVFVASLLGRRLDKIRQTAITLRPVMVVTSLFAAVLMAQSDLGTTIVLGAIVFAILFTAGVPLLRLGLVLLTAAMGAAAAALLVPYRRARLLTFLDPWEDPAHHGYQVIQSLTAIGSGGITGLGLGASRAKWGFLPFAHTDFIFAVIAEELGLVGAVGLILLFVALGCCGIYTAHRAPDGFGALLAVGVTTWLVVQAFVNIGAATAVLPVTGLPLPFISSGGSSIVVAMVGAGMLVNVARHTR